jgi:hypothetical protein
LKKTLIKQQYYLSLGPYAGPNCFVILLDWFAANAETNKQNTKQASKQTNKQTNKQTHTYLCHCPGSTQFVALLVAHLGPCPVPMQFVYLFCWLFVVWQAS